jgi:hypothetical protein
MWSYRIWPRMDLGKASDQQDVKGDFAQDGEVFGSYGPCGFAPGPRRNVEHPVQAVFDPEWACSGAPGSAESPSAGGWRVPPRSRR